MELQAGSLGVDEQATYEAAASGKLAGVAINQWWERWAWRTPRGGDGNSAPALPWFDEVGADFPERRIAVAHFQSNSSAY